MDDKVKGVFVTPQRTAGRIWLSFPHNITEYGGPTGPLCPQPPPPSCRRRRRCRAAANSAAVLPSPPSCRRRVFASAAAARGRDKLIGIGRNLVVKVLRDCNSIVCNSVELQFWEVGRIAILDILKYPRIW